MNTRLRFRSRARSWTPFVAMLTVVALAGCGTRASIEEINSAERGDVGLDPSALALGADQGTGAGLAPAGVVDSPAGVAVAPGVATVTGTAGAATPSGGSPNDAKGVVKQPSKSTVAVPGTAPVKKACTGTEAPIVIGQIGAFTGLIGAALGGARLGMALWAQSVNAAGGIACHPVKLYQLDDGSSPSQAAAHAEDLIKNKKAIAIVGVAQPIVVDATRSVTDKAGIPIVGGDLLNLAWSVDPLMFGQGTSALSSFAVGLQAAAEQKKATKAGLMYCVEASICSDLNKAFDGMAKVAGVQVVFRQSMSLTQTSFTSYCQNAKSAGVELLYLGMEGGSVQRIANSCASIGYYPTLVTPGLALPSSLESNEQLQRNTVYLGTSVAPFMMSTLPAQQAFQAAAKRFGGGQGLDQNTMMGWTSGKLFEAAITAVATKVEGRAVTTADVLDGLYSLPRNETLGGLAPPLNFAKGKPAANIACGWTVALLKGGFAAPIGNKQVGRCSDPAP